MPRLIVDRYELFRELASGGMATVWLGRLRGESGFTRTVAIKRLHAHLAANPQFVTMMIDEARLASRIRHPNVVSTVDVVRHQAEVLLVMDYVHGVSLAKVIEHVKAVGGHVPLPVIGAVVSGMLQGLHAAHEALDEFGQPLHIVHRDVSPQNVLVGADGVARVVDFGVAKAAGRLQDSSAGQVKGKVAYMAPEQLTGLADRRTDIFAAAVVLWELLTGRRLFASETEVETITKILSGPIPSPREYVPALSELIEELVMAGLDRVPQRRFANAREMDQALHRCMPVASTFDVAEWVNAMLGPSLNLQAQLVSDAETSGPESVPVSTGELDRTAAEDRTTRTAAEDDSLVGLQSARTTSARRYGIVAFFLAVLAAGLWVLVTTVHARGVAVVTTEDAGPAAFAAGAAPVPGVAAGAASAAASAPTTASASASNADVVAGQAGADSGATAGGVGGASGAGSATSKRVDHAGHAAGPMGSPKRKKAVSCDPPYIIDARGKHFKEECVD